MVELSSLLKFEDVSLSFGGITALKNVSFDVKENSITSIIGPSGCGKSTLLNILGLLDSNFYGNYFFESKSIKEINSLLLFRSQL